MAHRDFAGRSGSKNKKKAKKSFNRNTLIGLALVVVLGFGLGLYFLKNKTPEPVVATTVQPEKTQPKSVLPNRPEEVWHYIKELETRTVPVDNNPSSVEKNMRLTEEQRQVLIQMEKEQKAAEEAKKLEAQRKEQEAANAEKAAAQAQQTQPAQTAQTQPTQPQQTAKTEVKKPEPFEVNRRKEEVQKVDQQGQGVQQQVEKQRQAVQQQIEKPSHPVKKTPTASESSKNTKKPTYAGLNYNTQKKDFPQYKTDELSSNQMTLREDPVFSVQARPDRKILGQLFKTYWLIEYEDQLFIMDQHAAHEKVNYERLMKNFKEKDKYSQRLEPPMVVTVSMTEAEALTRYKDAFAGLGFTIESFGGNEYCIRVR